MLGDDLSLLRLQDEIPQTGILVSSSISKRLNRQRVLGVDLSLLRLQDKILQTGILVSSSIGERLNRQCVLGVDISFLRIQDEIPHACKAWILVLLITTCHNIKYVGFCSFYDQELNDNAC